MVEATTCQNNCSSNGRCQRGRCICKEGFTGFSCNQVNKLPENKYVHSANVPSKEITFYSLDAKYTISDKYPLKLTLWDLFDCPVICFSRTMWPFADYHWKFYNVYSYYLQYQPSTPIYKDEEVYIVFYIKDIKYRNWKIYFYANSQGNSIQKPKTEKNYFKQLFWFLSWFKWC